MATPRGSTAAVVIACACALAACGSSKTSSTSTSSSPPPTKAAATSAANAINLKAADIPGSTATPNPSTPGGLDAQLASCAGTSPPSTEIVNINSPTLATGSGLSQQSYSSNVTVLPSQSTVGNDLAAIKSDKGRSCVESLLPKAIAQAGNTSQVKFGGATLAALSQATPSGADGSFAYRITISATAAGQKIPIIIDVFGLAVARTEVRLSDFGINQPVPASEEQRLLNELASRAAANKV